MATIRSVHVDQVTKLFGAVRALTGVSMSVNAGDAVAVMGANGAGKSTLLSLLALRTRANRGSVLFNGNPAVEDRSGWRGRIGLLSHEPLIYPDLTARYNLMLFGRLYGIEDVETRVSELVQELRLESYVDDRTTRTLSRGQLQRVALARALVSDPELLLLDEPAAGLDQKAVERIEWAVGRLLDKGGMAVVVTHDPEVAHRVANRALMLRRGRVAADVSAPSDVDGWRSLYFDAIGGDGT